MFFFLSVLSNCSSLHPLEEREEEEHGKPKVYINEKCITSPN